MAKEKKAPGDGGGLLSRIEHNWIEIAAAALLALATIMSAFSAYAASQWSSSESEQYNKANAALVESIGLSDKANAELAVDIEMLSNYVNALMQGNTALAQLYVTDAFSDSLKTAFAAWTQAKANNQPDLPSSPFGMPEYKNKHQEESEALKRKSSAYAEKAKDNAKHSNNYILFTVAFASVLFFAGISTKFNGKGVKVAMLSMGMAVFVVAAVLVATQP
jgi:hypothetical protein